MIKKEKYNKPEIEIIKLELENTMAFSNNLDEAQDYSGVSNSRKKDFWIE